MNIEQYIENFIITLAFIYDFELETSFTATYTPRFRTIIFTNFLQHKWSYVAVIVLLVFRHKQVQNKKQSNGVMLLAIVMGHIS